jgi:hypothetical protein
MATMPGVDEYDLALCPSNYKDEPQATPYPDKGDFALFVRRWKDLAANGARYDKLFSFRTSNIEIPS